MIFERELVKQSVLPEAAFPFVHFTPAPTTGVKQPLQTGATPDFFNGIALEKTLRRLAGT